MITKPLNRKNDTVLRHFALINPPAISDYSLDCRCGNPFDRKYLPSSPFWILGCMDDQPQQMCGWPFVFRCRLRLFAACQTGIDIVYHGGQLYQTIDNIMRAGLFQNLARVIHAALDFGLG